MTARRHARQRAGSARASNHIQTVAPVPSARVTRNSIHWSNTMVGCTQRTGSPTTPSPSLHHQPVLACGDIGAGLPERTVVASGAQLNQPGVVPSQLRQAHPRVSTHSALEAHQATGVSPTGKPQENSKATCINTASAVAPNSNLRQTNEHPTG